MIGEKLQALLDAKNMKPGTLATRTGVKKSTIYSIIHRNNKSVDYSIMERICDELDVPIEYFYERHTSPESSENEKNAAPENGSGKITEIDLEIADIIQSLTPEKKDEALKFLRYLAAREDT